jgi:UDP-2,3-diacylglucosamine hydrolase
MAIANRGSYKSREISGEKRSRWSAREILKPYAQAILAAGHQAVVSGHYHQPFQEKLDGGELIALGDWITQYSYAVYEDHAFSLKSYPAAPSATDSTS